MIYNHFHTCRKYNKMFFILQASNKFSRLAPSTPVHFALARGRHLGDFWWTAARFGKMGPWTGCYNSYHGPVTAQPKCLKPPFTKFNWRLVIREYFFIAFNKNPSTAVYHRSCHRITFKSYSVRCRWPAIRKQQRKVNLIDPELLVGK